jgi:hypothetical protein
MEITSPAVGVLLTGVVGFVTWYAGILALVHRGEEAGSSEMLVMLGMLGAGLGLGGAVALVVGAVQMMRLRAYPLAVAAAILALVPWSPGWLLGLPFGIWALVVLHRREVKAAFLNNQDRAATAAPGAPAPERRATGKFTLFFRSLAGYFLPSFAGRDSGRQPGDGNPDGPDPATRRGKAL